MKTTKLLPTRTSTDWIVGWKVANLILESRTSRIKFMPVQQQGYMHPYDVDAEAKCGVKRRHKPPEATCRCGFNAFHDEEYARRYRLSQSTEAWSTTYNLVLLRVGLYGEVLEGTLGEMWGYKAERQRVDKIFIPTVCNAYFCDKPAQALGVLVGSTDKCFWGYNYLRPLCEAHLPHRLRRYTLKEAAIQMNIPVLWDTK